MVSGVAKREREREREREEREREREREREVGGMKEAEEFEDERLGEMVTL